MNTPKDSTGGCCPPPLCSACSEHVEASNLHFVLCGGLSVGMHTQPKVWRLRPKDEHLTVQQRTKDLQKLAGAMHYLVQCHPHLPPELAEKVARFCNMPNIPICVKSGAERDGDGDG
jgi:hypothetical protein